jgi:protein-S-isoprenylcysteine O-methyltransferase Ste14
MSIEVTCKVVLIFLYSLFSIIRIEYYRRAKKAGYKTVIEERRRYSIWLSIFICYEVFTFFLFILFPEVLSWAAIQLPVWARIIGVATGIAALLWFIWVHQSLGNNLSAKLRIKDQQVLVIDGPYRWIRHPMYSAFYLLHIAVFFLTANWFIGVTWLAGLTIIIFLRVKREEKMLLDRFGDQYVSYMERTGRFVPRIRQVKTKTE